MLKNITCCVCMCVLLLVIVYLFCTGTVNHTYCATATIDNISVREGSIDSPIIPNEENHIEEFMKNSGLSKAETMDIIRNPEKYIYIVCTVNIENKGDVKLLLKEPFTDMFEANNIWLLNEIEGYQEILPNTSEKTNVFLVASKSAYNKDFSISIPMTMEYCEKIAFKQIKDTIVVWAHSDTNKDAL